MRPDIGAECEETIAVRTKPLELILCLAILTTVLSGCLPASSSPTPQQTVQITMVPEASPTGMSDSEPIAVTKLVSGEVDGMAWAPDGMSVFYLARNSKASSPCCKADWIRLDLRTMDRESAEDVPNDKGESYKLAWLEEAISGWQISPNGERVLYQRKPENYQPPDPLPPMYVDPIELWSATIDGTDGIRLWRWEKGCAYIAQVEWFSDNRRAIVVCSGFEGGVFERIVVNVDGSGIQAFNQWIGIPGPDAQESLDIFAVPGYIARLSPDNSKAAFTKGNGELWIGFPDTQVPPDKVAELAFRPEWSSDGRRVYYLSIDQPRADLVPDIVMYDLVDKTQTVSVSQDVLSQIQGHVDIGSWIDWKLSPSESMLLVNVDSGLWLIRKQ